MSEDYDNLNAELATGDKAALELVQHLYRMGAQCGTIPVEWNGKSYVVSVEVVTVKQDK